MNFQSIRYFLQVEKKRSISQAAEDLYITQQTLSASIAALEKELGCALFVRHIPLELTYGGELFLEYARGFQQNFERMERDFAEIGDGVRGRLRAGVTVNRGRILMPAVVKAFHERFPKVEAEIVEESNDALLAALREGDIDLAVANFPGKIRGIVVEAFFEEEIVLALSEALLEKSFGGRREAVLQAFRKTQDLRLFADVPFLMSSARSASGRIARDLVRRAGLMPLVAAASGNMETLIEMCILGEGACFCPGSLLRTLLPAEKENSMTVLSLSDPETKYPVQFGWRRDEKEWKVRRAFIETAKEVMKAGTAPDPSEET